MHCNGRLACALLRIVLVWITCVTAAYNSTGLVNITDGTSGPFMDTVLNATTLTNVAPPCVAVTCKFCLLSACLHVCDFPLEALGSAHCAAID
jgi:hypothetical protein